MPRGFGGANVGYVDGHVDWHVQTTMGQTHPGVPQPSAGITSPANSGANFKPGYRQLYDAIYGYRYLF
jgi:prepilin-type processing-associated H-X9-DG protein